MIKLVQDGHQFGGSKDENPHEHIEDFADICESQSQGQTDAYKLRLFSFTLKDQAKKWWRAVPKETKTSWKKVKEAFLEEYCPRIKIVELRDQMTTYKQIDNERIGRCWTRYKELVQSCPGHGFPDWVVVEYFYKGLLPESKLWVDMSAGGALGAKDGDFVQKLLDTVEYNEHQWNPKLATSNSQRDERVEIRAQLQMLDTKKLPTVSEILHSKLVDELSNDFSVESAQQ